MDLSEIEREVARLDAAYRPVATKPIDIMDPDAFKNMGATRDEVLTLRDLCDRALRAGIDVDPILAAMSSDVDRYGMGSMRDVILRYGPSSES